MLNIGGDEKYLIETGRKVYGDTGVEYAQGSQIAFKVTRPNTNYKATFTLSGSGSVGNKQSVFAWIGDKQTTGFTIEIRGLETGGATVGYVYDYIDYEVWD